MTKILTITSFILFILTQTLASQTGFRVMSYNVENLFDCKDDPHTADEDFTPTGSRYWTPKRFYHKLQQIARVITAAGEWDTPILIGLCEVENDSVLFKLLHHTPLRHQYYQYRITHGKDLRGINVALLYQRDRFKCLGHKEYPIFFTNKSSKPSRNILHVWGELLNKELLHVFVCHFPSRYGGEKESESARFDAARTLRALCDSLYSIAPQSHFLIMGDFNDTPKDISIRQILDAQPLPNPSASDSEAISIPFSATQESSLQLYNLCTEKYSTGSHKYQGEWSQLDQIIVSSSLIHPQSPLQVLPQTLQIMSPSFLLIKDKTWYGKRPYRTYYGYKYEGGYSDHLPIIVDFQL
ncbi:MAG: endonuclease, partial [Parabacteroides sp.]|nr:endonuclease [Parabacteroides sp.]